MNKIYKNKNLKNYKQLKDKKIRTKKEAINMIISIIKVPILGIIHMKKIILIIITINSTIIIAILVMIKNLLIIRTINLPVMLIINKAIEGTTTVLIKNINETINKIY